MHCSLGFSSTRLPFIDFERQNPYKLETSIAVVVVAVFLSNFFFVAVFLSFFFSFHNRNVKRSVKKLHILLIFVTF